MNIIIMGAPGSGKSTQGKLLAKKLGLAFVASGDVTRQIASENTDEGQEVKEIMERGDLPPFRTLFRRVVAILESEEAKNGAVMDGYPREEDQIYVVENYLQEKGKQVDKVIVVDLPDDEGIKRVLSRAAIEGRPDDTKEVITERLKIYHERTKPIIDYFEKQGKVNHVDGSPTIEEIHASIMKLFENEN